MLSTPWQQGLQCLLNGMLLFYNLVRHIESAQVVCRQAKVLISGSLAAASSSSLKCIPLLQVVRSQAKGLETEYDRLLSEHDELQRRLRRTDPTYGGGGRCNKFD